MPAAARRGRARAEALEAVLPGESPTAYVQRVARAKTRPRWRAWRQSALPPAPLLCADTTVAVGGTILGKPQDADDAARMLRLLSGRTHRVLTTVVVAPASSARLLAATQVSRVRFCRLKPAQVEAYIASGEPFGKAGALCHPGTRGRVCPQDRRISLRYHGLAALRNCPAAAQGRLSHASMTAP